MNPLYRYKKNFNQLKLRGYQAGYNTRLQVKIYCIKEVKLYEESQSSIIKKYIA